MSRHREIGATKQVLREAIHTAIKDANDGFKVEEWGIENPMQPNIDDAWISNSVETKYAAIIAKIKEEQEVLRLKNF